MTVNAREEFEDEINLADYWRALKKRWGLIVGLTLISMLTAGVYCYFLATKIYESKVSILQPKESGGGSGLVSALAALGNSTPGQLFGGILPSTSSNREVFMAVLKSRTVAEEIISRFNLKQYYGLDFMEDVVKALRGVTDIQTTKDGTITITVEDKDPKLASDIANAYTTMLDRMLARFATTDAGRQRVFLVDRLDQTEKALKQSENALRRFQESHKAVVLPEQSRGSVEASSRIKGEIIAAEVALEALRSFATESNPGVIQQKIRIEELKRQLSKFQYGGKEDLPSEEKDSSQRRSEFMVPFSKVPEVAMELLRLTREMKIQETVFTLLTQQYEQAKIAEAKDMPNVQVIDKAIPAERKSKPKTLVTMTIAGILSLVVGIFLSLVFYRLDLASTDKQELGIGVASLQ